MKVVLLLAIILTYFTAAGQKSTVRAEVSGIVLDSMNRKPLRTASVSLLAQKDSAYVTASITDGDGRFRFKNVSAGQYRLLITFIGYRNQSVPFEVSDAKPLYLDTLWMKEQGTDLQEVVIKQEAPPVRIKQDTIEFNAGSFKTEPNAQLEEMLKKLPGVEVARDGSIRANGQAVNKVLVDGKPFFGNDPKMATRNLPADIVDKVQVFDQSSDQSQFSGIDDGNRERTINITIKKDKGKGYFGQNSVGAGNAGRYLGRLNVNRFNNRNGGPGKQLSVVGQANNLNQQNFTLDGSNVPGLGSGSSGGPAFVGEPGSGGQDFNPTPSNTTEVKAAGINYRTEGSKVKWGKRAEMAASYFANQGITTADQQSRRQNILPNQSFLIDQSNYSRNALTTHRLNGRLDFQLDSLTSLRISPNISWQTSDYKSRITNFSYLFAGDSLNTGNTQYNLNGTAFTGYNNLLFMRKLRKKGRLDGRTFSANLNTVLNDGKSIAFNRSVNTFNDSTASSQVLDQRNRQDNYGLQNTFTLSFTEHISFTQKLEFKYALIQNANKQARQVFDKNDENTLYNLPDSLLSNRFAGVFSTNRLGAAFQNRRLRYSYTFGMDFQQARQKTENLTQNSDVSKNYFHFLPNALFNYTFPGSRSLRIQYRTRITPAGITQLQPVADNSNPLNIKTGNPTLRPEYYNTVTLVYSSSPNSGQKSLFISANLNLSNNHINSATSISENGVRITKPVNTEGFRALNGFLAWTRRIDPAKLTVSLMTNGNFARNTSLINDKSNISKNVTLGQGLRVQSNYSDKIDFGITGRVSYQKAGYSLLAQQNAKYWSQYAIADVHWQLPLLFVVTTDLTYNATSGRSAGYNQRFTLWNASIAKQFLKGKQGEIRLQVFDILNQNRSLVRNTSEAYIEDVQSRVLKRYFMVSFLYNLRKFGI